MIVPKAAVHLRRRPASPAEAQAADRRLRRKVGLAWGLLLLNVLTYYPGTWSGQPLVIPLPSSVGKLITQGSLPLALLVILSINRRLLIRPNVFLCIATLLFLGALMAMSQPEHVGTLYRTARLGGFIAALWLLTPFWGRRDLLLLRCHLKWVAVIGVSVVLGLIAAPSSALSQGRLSGTLWPFPPTDVAHFSAVMAGLTVILWFSGLMRGRVAAAVAGASVVILLMTHTRTALVAMLAGLLVAGLSLMLARARVRKLLTGAVIVVAVGFIAFSSAVMTWLARGEGTSQLTGLTGRTDVWSALVGEPRNKFEVLFGSGLSNKSFNGMPIDSNWLAAYNDIGLFGVAVGASLLVFLLVTAYFQPRGPERALGLFLVTYCLLSSFTETGLSDASAFLLELTLAASMLIPPVASRSAALPSALDRPVPVSMPAGLPADTERPAPVPSGLSPSLLVPAAARRRQE